MSKQEQEQREQPSIPSQLAQPSLLQAEYAKNLRLQSENTHLKYANETQHGQIVGLMKVGRDVQKYRQGYVDYLKRAFGNIEGIWGGGFKFGGAWMKYLIVLVGFGFLLYYLNYSGAGAGIEAYAMANSYSVLAALILGIVVFVYLMNRRRNKR